MYHIFAGKRYRDYYVPFIIICMFSCIFFSGCNKPKKISPVQYGYVSYIIKWDSILKSDAPKETLRFCFYSADNGPMIQTDTDSGSLKIALAPGKYGLLVYNYGENHLLLKNRTNFERTEAAFVTDENGGSKLPSAPLYGVVIKEFEVLPNQNVTTLIMPTLFTKKVYFRVNFRNDQLRHIRDCQGVLTGVTPQLHICNRTVSRETTTSLPVLLGKTDSSYHGKVLLLDGAYNGQHEDTIAHELTLDFLMADGSTVTAAVNMGASIFNIKKQDIMVDINAYLDMTSGKKIALECASVDIYKKEI